MGDESRGSDEAGESRYVGDIDPDAIVGETQLQPTPHQHEKLKDGLHGDDRFEEIRRADRRYLVIGRGGEEGPGKRRLQVCRQLDARTDASAFRLEDFGFTGDDLDVWAPAFDILSAMASHIVGVLEDFDGGHVWELGYLYHHQLHARDILWLLKRIYESDERTRAKYDNGMAASHLAALENAAGERVLTWSDESDLTATVRDIP
jgi:hypothetical protein